MPINKADKEALIRSFAQFVPREAVEKALAGDNSATAPRRVNIDYVLVQIAEDDDALASRISLVISLLTDNEYQIESLMGTCVCATYADAPTADRCFERFWTAAQGAHGNSIRAVHGKTDALCGTFGGPRRFFSRCLILGLEQSLGRLFSIPFGTSKFIDI